jgi:hypothetical protein
VCSVKKFPGAAWLPHARVRPNALLLVAIFAAIACISALGIAGMLPMGGAKFGAFVAILCVALPLVLLVWIRWPLIMPFCLYAALVPFDGVPLGGIGSVPHLLGLLSFGGLLFSVLLRRQAVMPSRAVVAWLAATLWMLTTLAWAEMLPVAELQMGQFAQLIGLAFIVSIVRVSLVELNAVVIATIAGGVGASLFEIWLYQTGSLTAHAGVGEARACVAVAGNCLDPNFFAAGLILPIILSVVGGLRSRNFIAKCLFIALALTEMLGVFASGSRGVFSALGVGLLYLFVRTRYRIQLATVTAAGLLGSLALPVIWARNSDPGQGEASGRFEAWKVGLYSLRDHWFAGAGLGSYRSAYEAAYLHVYQTRQFHTPSQDPHNLLLQTTVELGVIGLVLVVGAWVLQLTMLRAIPRANPLYDLRCAVEAATIAILVTAFTVDLMNYKFTWLCFSLAFLTRSAWQGLPTTVTRVPVEPPVLPGFAGGRRPTPAWAGKKIPSAHSN